MAYPDDFTVFTPIVRCDPTECTDVSNNGSINLNNGVWQQIAIPVNKTVKEYFIDGIDTLIKTYDNTKSVSDVIERVSAYYGMNNSFLTYIPGVTPDTSDSNFMLLHTDNNITEITAFWVKVLDYKAITNNEDLVFNWDAAD